MAANGDNNNTISLSFELTKTGVKLGAQSRLMSAVDKLGSDIVEIIGSPLADWNEKRRARAEGEAKLIREAVDYAVGKIRDNPSFAERIYARHFEKAAKEQINKDAVIFETINTLQETSYDGHSDNFSDTPLSEEFLQKIDGYAASASTDAVRQKWGRVIAAEVRAPGTFSTKVLRIVDEISSETAMLFEQVCALSIADIIPRSTAEHLDSGHWARLTTAGLIWEVSAGHSRHLVDASHLSPNGERMWILGLGRYGIGINTEFSDLPNILENYSAPIRQGTQVPCAPVYVLTDEGRAIKTILPNTETSALDKYIEKIREQLPKVTLHVFEIDEKTQFASMIKKITP